MYALRLRNAFYLILAVLCLKVRNFYRLAHDLERMESLYFDSNGHDQKRKPNSSEVSVKPASLLVQ